MNKDIAKELRDLRDGLKDPTNFDPAVFGKLSILLISNVDAILSALEGERDAEIDRELENAQWLRFAEAFVPTAQDCHAYGEHQKVANYAADFADAMVREAKERGRL